MKKTNAEQTSLLHSYFTILADFAKNPLENQPMLEYMIHWGIQLGIPEKEIRSVMSQSESYYSCKPEQKMTCIQHLYNLVYLIYMDQKVDDEEIEILMQYATKMGFSAYIIGDIIKAMLTAPTDGLSEWDVKNELKILLQAYNTETHTV